MDDGCPNTYKYTLQSQSRDNIVFSSSTLSLDYFPHSQTLTALMAEEHGHHLFHHKKEEETPVEAATYGEPTDGGGYGEIDHRKEEKHHKHHEHLGELGAAGAGTYALVRNH